MIDKLKYSCSDKLKMLRGLHTSIRLVFACDWNLKRLRFELFSIMAKNGSSD